MNEPVTIDPEFQALIPPLSADEYKQLEENCKKDGILDSLKVWHGVLIDGHNRFRISEEWDLNYETCEIDLPNREAARAWIANNQLGRRNINDLIKIELARIAKQEIEKEAEKRVGGRPKKDEKADKNSCPVSRQEKREHSTAYKLAKAAGMSEDKFRKGETILDSGNQEIINAVRSGEISINNGYQQVMREKTPVPPKPSSESAEAKQRHKEYEQKKSDGVISIQDAIQDKEDRKTIAKDLYSDLLSLTRKSYWIGSMNSSKDFEMIADVVPKESRPSMVERIRKMIIVLDKVLEVLDES